MMEPAYLYCSNVFPSFVQTCSSKVIRETVHKHPEHILAHTIFLVHYKHRIHVSSFCMVLLVVVALLLSNWMVWFKRSSKAWNASLKISSNCVSRNPEAIQKEEEE
jgi:hypothetical protein